MNINVCVCLTMLHMFSKAVTRVQSIYAHHSIHVRSDHQKLIRFKFMLINLGNGG